MATNCGPVGARSEDHVQNAESLVQNAETLVQNNADILNKILNKNYDQIIDDVIINHNKELNEAQINLCKYDAKERKLLRLIEDKYENTIADYMFKYYYDELNVLYLYNTRLLYSQPNRINYVKKYKIDVLKITKLPSRHIVFGNISNEIAIDINNFAQLLYEDVQNE